jgi:hypothetical protein
MDYFQRLWRKLFVPDADSITRLEQLFDLETAELDLNYAFLSHIDLESETQRFDVVHGSHEALQPQNTVPLSKTYCRKTIEDQEGTLAVSDALSEGWEDDPAYQAFELGSYLGTTISVDGELYGTLCFANTAPRDQPIADTEKALIKMHGQWVEYMLDLRDGSSLPEQRFDTIEERAVSSEAIDLMMDALRERTRRVILMKLIDGPTKISLETLERQVNEEEVLIRLIHVDLPKLADAGYINWDTDSETVSKGSRFAEVEPLVRLLKAYDTTFPE